MFRGCLAGVFVFFDLLQGRCRPTTFHALGCGSIVSIFVYFVYCVANAFHVVTCAATSDVSYRLTAIESNSEEKDAAP